MTTAASPSPAPAATDTWPRPWKWTREKYYRLGELGIFDRPFGRRRVELLDGDIWEQHHDDLTNPAPRLFPFTWEQLLKVWEAGLFDGQRVELVHGRVLVMSPMNDPHAHGIVLALHALQSAFGPNHTLRPQLPMLLSAGVAPEPDLAVVAGPPRSNPSHPTTALLVVEVSDTTIDYDTTTKAGLYATAGIPEYWVVDLPGHRLLVFRDPAPLPAGLGASAYQTQLTLGPADSVAPLAVPSATVRVADLLP
jgi:Uma2 family endonuclease